MAIEITKRRPGGDFGGGGVLVSGFSIQRGRNRFGKLIFGGHRRTKQSELLSGWVGY